jgi:hypothetical protein
MFDEIRPEGSLVTPPDKLAAAKARNAQKRAMKVATGERLPKEPPKPSGRPKSVVNRVTEYGSLFNKLNEERLAKGLAPLKTAMEVLIDAMQSDELDIKDKARIADKLAPFESSRAPVISIEHVQNITKDEESTAEEAMDEFLESLRKV